MGVFYFYREVLVLCLLHRKVFISWLVAEKARVLSSEDREHILVFGRGNRALRNSSAGLIMPAEGHELFVKHMRWPR